MDPTRIQLSRARGWRMPPNTVKVDRTTKWGNPFLPTDICISKGKLFGQPGPIGAAGAVAAFETLVLTGLKRAPVETRALLDELRGKSLACWCKPGTPCHGDVLLRLVNTEPTNSRGTK